jgi:acetyl-CoA synthetase
MRQRREVMADFAFGGEFVWWPDPEVVERSNLKRFMRNTGARSLDDLYPRSLKDVARFWDAALADLDIQFYQPYTQIAEFSGGIEWPVWCVDGVMNIAHNCLDKWVAAGAGGRVALRWEGEEGQTRALTYAELTAEVAKAANALRALGVGKGDAVGLFMPMIPEIVVALLAICKIGGIVVPLFSGYGDGAVVSRLSDAGAVALFTADGMLRRGKLVLMKPVADAAAAHVPSLRHVIVVSRLGEGDMCEEIETTAGRDHWWHELVAGQADRAPTEQTSAEDPLMLIYTSGTTGQPKGAVHTHCGFPIKAALDLSHCFDLKQDDVLYWITDMGWMMGPWEVWGALLLGAGLLLYDGAPDYPQVDRQWALVERHGVTGLGVSPTLIRSLRPHGREPAHKHDTASLRWVGSTGSPWDPDTWLWLFELLGKRTPIINYTGGTEISGAILSSNLLQPIKPAAFSGPATGMSVDVLDAEGKSVRGEVGELAIRLPWIGMTRGFWRDTHRYIEAYWSRFPGVWVHGDWAAVDGDGQWYILGRSDDTIKVAGKRVGPAEVEAVLCSHPAVTLAAAIGVPEEMKGEEIVCFCMLAPGREPTEALRRELMALVIEEMGKPLKPRDIKFVTALPRTRNAKIMHRVIRAAYLGKDAGDVTSLEDPATVEAIKNAH